MGTAVLAAARRLVVSAFVFVALTVPATASAAGCAGADSAPAAADGAAATLCLLNAERAAQGLDPLARSGALDSAAGAHAGDMVARRFFAHESPEGGTLLGRLRTAGWMPASGSWSAGEDIAWGSGDRGTPTAIVAAWMASPGHRANILRPEFDEVGLGIVAGAPLAGVPGAAGTYVADFGVRDVAVAPVAVAPQPAAAPAKAKKPVARCARAAVKRGRGKSAARRCVIPSRR